MKREAHLSAARKQTVLQFESVNEEITSHAIAHIHNGRQSSPLRKSEFFEECNALFIKRQKSCDDKFISQLLCSFQHKIQHSRAKSLTLMLKIKIVRHLHIPRKSVTLLKGRNMNISDDLPMAFANIYWEFGSGVSIKPILSIGTFIIR